MAQGPIPVKEVTAGGVLSKKNITAAAVVKAAPGRLRKITVQAPGTSGSWTINDCATLGAAAAGNTIYSATFNATFLVAGSVITLDWPFVNGLVVSAVPGGSPVLAVTYD